MRRIAAIIGLLPEKTQEYLDLHAAGWPQVQQRLRDSHITNYSIFLRDGLLFGYYEYVGEDYEADMAAIAADEATQRWWALTAPCQQPLASAGPEEWWVEAKEVFRLDEN